MQVAHLEMTLCELRRKVADLMFLHDLLNGNIDFSELLEMVGFCFNIYCTTSKNLFRVSLFLNSFLLKITVSHHFSQSSFFSKRNFLSRRFLFYVGVPF